MIKINIQLFGGRGANSGYGNGMSTGGKGSRVTAFYDKTNQYKGMALHQFENAVRDKNVEYMAGYNAKGELIIAGTSNNKGAVVVPENSPQWKDVVTLTHNHPYQGNRVIGGSFSAADVQNHLRLGLKGETRAVSNGPNENTYIFRAKSGVKQKVNRMTKISNKIEAKYKAEAQRATDKVQAKLKGQGKSLNGKSNQVYIGTAKRLWKSAKVDRYGYEYIEVNKAHW